ncbi:hypothetical protein F5I97DRAFT_321655 [Phlebopus sp. FC_14]|nr:hypothetical protein F5I97DRAFT_321655 [Phlebopus sp. FC_14]
MGLTFKFVAAPFPSFPRKVSYFTHDRLEKRITIRTYVAPNGMGSTLLLLKYFVLTISFNPSSQVDSSIPPEPRAEMGCTSGMSGCASSSATNSICSRAATNSGATELWSRTYAFEVGSGERDAAPRLEDAELEEEVPCQSSGRSMSIEGVLDIKEEEGLVSEGPLPVESIVIRVEAGAKRKFDLSKRLFCLTNSKVPGRDIVTRLRL